MINGERTGQNPDSNSAVACDYTLDELSPWLDHKSEVDGCPSPSSYSSCEGSEFERYCSANSILGTASLCSSFHSSFGTCNEFLGSEFGSSRNLAIGRSSGSQSAVAVSEGLDCLSDGGNESHEESTGIGNQLLGGEMASPECRSGSVSLVGSDVNSSSFRANYEENCDEILTDLGVEGDLNLFWNPYKRFQSCSNVREEHDDTNAKSLGIAAVSGLLLTSGENGRESLMLQSGGNEAICEVNNNMDSHLLRDGNKLCALQGSKENSLLPTDICEDKSVEDPIEYVHNSSSLFNQQLVSIKSVQDDGKESEAVQEVDEETSLRSGHSDAEDSMVDYGTDDDDRTFAEQRNLQYIKETKIKRENTLLMNSVVAFGSYDWDEYMLELEGNSMAPVMLERPLKQQQEHLETESNPLPKLNSCPLRHTASLSHEGTVEDEPVRVPIASYQVLDSSESAENLKSCSVGNFLVEKEMPTQNPEGEKPYMFKVADAAENNMIIKDDAQERELHVQRNESFRCNQFPEGDIPIASYQVQDINESPENLKSCWVGNFLVKKELPAQNPEGEKPYMYKVSDAAENNMIIKDDAHERELQCVCSEEPVGPNEDDILKTETSDLSDLPLDPLTDIKVDQFQSTPAETLEDKETGLCKEHKLSTPLPLVGKSNHIHVMQIAKNSAASVYLGKECLAPAEVEKLETDEFYDEMVHEMEEILLDSGGHHGARFSHSSQRSLSQLSQSFRDGGSTASTSGTDDAYPPVPYPLKIDWVEVVGAKQKRGDVSLGERLVGVKEYTVYIIRVWSGKEQWDIERRYRDFYTLYRQLKILFADRGCSLPIPWSRIDRESRKIFGNASPNVISERSILIQDCIRSILNESPFGTPSSLVWFLSPCKSVGSFSTLHTMATHSMEKLAKDNKLASSFCGETFSGGSSSLGKTISLVVDIKPCKSVEQLLEAQYYTCAGCHKQLDAGKSLVQELVQTFGWGKPRLCEYTSQLFCASCHTNDTAVLPARVLHFWDFSLYPVSQLAKAYLESIYDQPMLCVSAVNPFLFSKVPTLLHVMGIRKKIGAMLPYLQCPFRRSIQRGLGSRRYLLENNEFFALRDLVDLSKGAFAALPATIETVSVKIHEHITQQCLICCDVGIPCGARQACEDPASLIFPFQEAEVARCSSCDAVFHKPCFEKLVCCPCGTVTEAGKKLSIMEQGKHRDRDDTERSDISTRRHKSNSAVGFFSDLWGPRKESPVILMGSLPSTAL